jgi:predicted DNA-binding ribbon-helix-helix protein
MFDALRTRRNVNVGHRTSMLLEDPFWEALEDCAIERGVSVDTVVVEAEGAFPGASRSAALRMHLIEYFRERTIGA